MKINKIIWGIVAIVVLSTIVISFGPPDSNTTETMWNVSTATPTPELQDTRDLSKYGLVEYNSPPIANPREWERRQRINQKYDKQGWVARTASPGTGGIGKITDDPPPPLFPTEESPLILLGEVVKVTAHLSNDKEGVYSEFTIRVDEVLKNTCEKNKPDRVMAEREGGVVVYPNGQRIRYQNSDRGLPQLGSKYLFFLTKQGDNPNYEILTSYLFTSEGIWQMEMGSPFDEFKAMSKAAFLETIRAKIARPTRND